MSNDHQVILTSATADLVRLRGAAIENYAHLEQGLCEIFAHLLKTDIRTSGIVFYKISNTGSRNKIIGELIFRRFENKYDVFWKSLKKHLQEINESRNKIVHYHSSFSMTNSSSPEQITSHLSPPESWGDGSILRPSDIKQFIDYSEFIGRAVNLFALRLNPLFQNDTFEWERIFQQALPYPPAQDHPLAG